MGMQSFNNIKANIYSIYTYRNTPHRPQADQALYYIKTLEKRNFEPCSLLISGPPLGLVDLRYVSYGLLSLPTASL